MSDDDIKIRIKPHSTADNKPVKQETEEAKTGEVKPAEIKVGEELAKTSDTTSDVELGQIEKAKKEQELAQLATALEDIGTQAQLPEDNTIQIVNNVISEIGKEASKQYSAEEIIEALGIITVTQDGKKIADRINSLPKEALSKIKKTEDIRELLKDNELEVNFDNVSNVLELISGITLRTPTEYKKASLEREEIITQLKAQDLVRKLFLQEASWNDQYTNSIGPFGMFAEVVHYVTNKTIGEADLNGEHSEIAETLRKFAHFVGEGRKNHYQWANYRKECAQRAADLKVLNPDKFKEGFKNILGEYSEKYGISFNVEAFKKLFEIIDSKKAQKEDGSLTDEYKDAIRKAINIELYNPNANTVNTVMNSLGETILMLGSLGLAAEAKGGQVLAQTSINVFNRLGTSIASKQVNNKLLKGALRLAGKGVSLMGPAINEGTKLYTYTALTGTGTNIGNRVIKGDYENFLQYQADVMSNANGSFAFGAFAGMFGTAVTTKVMQSASRVSSKVTEALSEKFAKGAIDASEVYSAILQKSVPTVAGEVAAFCTDVVGFTAFESAMVLVKNIDGFPEKITPQDITNLLWEEFKGQGYNLGQIKLVSHAIMWMNGSRSARKLSMNYLKNNMPELKGITVEQHGEGYSLNCNGRKIECKNTNEMISSLHLLARGQYAFDSRFDSMVTEEQAMKRLATALSQSSKDRVKDTDKNPSKEKIKDTIARTINLGNEIATEVAPLLSVYGDKLPALPAAFAKLAGTKAGLSGIFVLGQIKVPDTFEGRTDFLKGINRKITVWNDKGGKEELLFSEEMIKDFAKDEKSCTRLAYLERMIGSAETEVYIKEVLSLSESEFSKLKEICPGVIVKRNGEIYPLFSLSSGLEIIKNPAGYERVRNLLDIYQGKREPQTQREKITLNFIKNDASLSKEQLFFTDDTAFEKAIKLRDANQNKSYSLSQCFDFAKDEETFRRALSLLEFKDFKELSVHHYAEILKFPDALEKLNKLLALKEASSEELWILDLYKPENLKDDVFNEILKFATQKKENGKPQYSLSDAISLAEIQDEQVKAEIIKLYQKYSDRKGNPKFCIIECRDLLDLKNTNTPELYDQVINLSSKINFLTLPDLIGIANNPILSQRVETLSKLMPPDLISKQYITDNEKYNKIITLSNLKSAKSGKPILTEDGCTILRDSDCERILRDEQEYKFVVENIEDFADSYGKLIIPLWDLRELAKDPETLKKAKTVFKIMDYDGQVIMPLYKIKELYDSEQLKKIEFLADHDVVVDYKLFDALIEPEMWNKFMDTMNTPLSNGEKPNASLAAVICDSREKAQTIIEPLITAKKQNGDKLFTHNQVARIMKFCLSTTKEGSKIAEYLIKVANQHIDDINFITNNANLVWLLGYDTVKKLDNYSCLGNPSTKEQIFNNALKRFLHGNSKATAEFLKRTKICDFEELTAYKQKIFSENLDFNLLQEINELECNDQMKQYLVNHLYDNSEVSLKTIVEQIRELLSNHDADTQILNLKTCFDFDLSITSSLDTILCQIDYIKKHPNLKLFELSGANFMPRYYFSKLDKATIDKIEEIYKKQLEKCLTHPELYVNGEYNSVEASRKKVDNFFDKNKNNIKLMADIIGPEALDDLLRYRFDDAIEYLKMLQPGRDEEFTYVNMQLLKAMVNSKKPDGKPFISTEKVAMLDTLFAYKGSKADLTNLKNMVKSNALDIPQLHRELLDNIFLLNGFTQDEIASIPAEKRAAWDFKYIHLLAKETLEGNDGALTDLFRVANFGDLISYIHDTSNPYGQANAQTQEIFRSLKLNYDAWLKPSEKCEVKFTTTDVAHDRLLQISSQIIEDIESLRATTAKGIIDKTFSKYIKEGKFFIPASIIANKEKLTNFVKNLHTQLNVLWKRAEGNKTSADSEVAQRAQNTLTIKSHLDQRIEDIQTVQKDNGKKALKWKIKMWDRNPQKDIFQGNYSTCCIGMAGGNGSAMPHYLMDTMFNMIEIVDETTGRVVGNALCYYAKDADNRPALIIDNIEINNHYKPSSEVGESLRTAIAEYARNINLSVTGDENTPIILGKNYNDVPVLSDISETPTSLSLAGKTDCEEIYIDLFGGWKKSTIDEKVKYYDLSGTLPEMDKARKSAIAEQSVKIVPKTITKEEFVNRILSLSIFNHYNDYLDVCLEPDGKTVTADVLGVIEKYFSMGIGNEEMIRHLVVAYKENPERITELLNLEIKSPNKVLEAEKINPQVTKQLIDIGEKDGYGIFFSAQDTVDYPEFSVKCLKQGIDRYSLKRILNLYQEDSVWTEKLIDAGFQNSIDMEYIIKVAKNQPDAVEKCISYGIKNGVAVKYIAETYQTDPQVTEWCLAAGQKGYYQIAEIVGLSKRNTDAVKNALNAGFIEPNDIEHIVEHNIGAEALKNLNALNLPIYLDDAVLRGIAKHADVIEKYMALNFKEKQRSKKVCGIGPLLQSVTLANKQQILEIMDYILEKQYDLHSISDASYYLIGDVCSKTVTAALEQPAWKSILDAAMNKKIDIEYIPELIKMSKNTDLALDIINNYPHPSPVDITGLIYYNVSNWRESLKEAEQYGIEKEFGAVAAIALARKNNHLDIKYTVNACQKANISNKETSDILAILAMYPDKLELLEKCLKIGLKQPSTLIMTSAYGFCDIDNLVNLLYENRITDAQEVIGNMMTDMDLKGSAAQIEYLLRKGIKTSKELMSNESKNLIQSQAALVREIADKIGISSKKYIGDDLKNSRIARILNIFERLSETEQQLKCEQIKRTIDSMKQRRDQLKSGVEDLPDTEIEEFVLDNYREIENAKKILGESGFVDSFGLKLEGLKKLTDDLDVLCRSANKENLESILEIFAPQESEKGKRIAKIVAQLNARNSELAKIPELSRKKPIMDIYNTRKKKLTAQIREKQEFLKTMPTKDKIEKLGILSAIQKFSPQKLKQFIKIINNNEVLKKAVNEEIFAWCNVPFDEAVSKKLGLEKSEFLTSIAIANIDFKNNLKILIETVKNNPEMTLIEALDTLPQNQQTRDTFEQLGLNYDRWIHADKDSFETVQVTLNAEKAKSAVIKSLESDFNDTAFKLIPEEERNKILAALKEKGITLEEENETIFDADGNETGTQKRLKLKYKGEPMPFDKMEIALSIIKTVMNQNEFWTVSNPDTSINEAKNTIHNHMIKLRGNELDVAKNAKGERTSTIEIRQTDMTDLVHSLFLGNHGACCTAVGGGCNQFSAPTYIMNRLISAIEVVDGKNFVGNSMIYIAEVEGVPALMIDNIELSAKYQFNDAIRDAFFKYASKLVEAIGKPDMPIYAGPHRHKLNMPEETKKIRTVKILGSTGEQEIYIDWQGHYTVDGERFENVDIYEIKGRTN